MRNLIRISALLALAGAAWPMPRAAGRSAEEYADQVLKLSVTYQLYDEDRPWAKTNPQNRYASAVVIDGPLLLTEAQMVGDATLIRVSRHGDGRKVPARVVHADFETNLALLAVDDEAFFEGLRPVRLAETVPTSGTLTSVRWNRRQLESADSRVTRLAVEEAYYGSFAHVFVFLRTDLRNGGWSDAVFDGDSFVGLGISQDDQVARVLPAPVIRDFLRRVAEGRAESGPPAIKLDWQVNHDEALAAYLGMPAPPTGIVVRRIPWPGTGWGELRSRDILLSLDGHEIGPDGYYEHPLYGRLLFTNIASDGHDVGDRIPAVVWRDGRRVELELTLRAYPTAMQLVPWSRTNQGPAFVIAGGLLFRELDGPYLRSWGKDWRRKAPHGLVWRRYADRNGQTPDRRRVVILAGVIPDVYTIGYHDLGDLEVASINGRPVDGIRDVIEALNEPSGGFHVIEFAPNLARAEMVLDAGGFEAATERILAAYGIPLRERIVDPPPAPAE